MLVANWNGVPGKHPTLGRNLFNVMVTDKRIAVTKASMMQKIGRGVVMGGAMSGALGGFAHAAAAGTLVGLGSLISRSSVPKVEESRQVASDEIDAYLQHAGMTQVPNGMISQVRLKKGGFLGSDKFFFQLPEGEFSGEIGCFKEAMETFTKIFPGRVSQQ